MAPILIIQEGLEPSIFKLTSTISLKTIRLEHKDKNEETVMYVFEHHIFKQDKNDVITRSLVNYNNNSNNHNVKDFFNLKSQKEEISFDLFFFVSFVEED